MADKQLKRYLKQAQESNGNYVLSYVQEIEREEFQTINKDNFVNLINVLSDKIDTKTAVYNSLSEELDNLNSEYEILYNLAVEQQLIDTDDEDSDDEESDDEE